MSEQQEFEALFLDNLGWIERSVASLCRRHGLSDQDTEDFAQEAKSKLVEDDYAVLRKFRGESSITTYLTVVIAMLFRDYRVGRWGRWRPSAEARRRGQLAVRLETLVYRDGYRFDQAAEMLRTSGETDLSDRELATFLAELPARTPLRPVEIGPEPLARTPGTTRADDLVMSEEVEAQRRAVDEALSRALERLPPEDRLIVRMWSEDGLSVADIARGLGLQQKPLYRRIKRALAQLRRQLEAAGITREQVRTLLGEPAS